MHRWVAALLLAVSALLAPAVPAAGQTATARAPTLVAVPADGSSLDPAGRGFDVTVDAGASTEQTLTLANLSSDQRYTVRVEPVEETSRGWITASTEVLVLEPLATAPVTLRFAVPGNAAAGELLSSSVRVFVQQATPVTPGGAAAPPAPEVVVPATLRVSGVPSPQLQITRVVAKDKDGETFLRVTVANTGAIEAVAAGSLREAKGRAERRFEVRVAPQKEATAAIPWALMDNEHGTDVVIELEYGDGDRASWVGNVSPDPTTLTPDDVAAARNGEAPDPGGGMSLTSVAGAVLAVVILLLMVGAAAWLVTELLRSRGPRRIPLDPAAIPQLQLMMDPRHTEVLDALVTQVGALGGAISHLADRVGVPVSIPPSPAPLLSPPRRRRHHDRHQPSEPAPVPVSTSVAPAFTPPPAPEPMEAPPAARAAVRRDPPPEASATQQLARVTEMIQQVRRPVTTAAAPPPRVPPPLDTEPAPPPRFVPPPPPGDEWLRDDVIDARIRPETRD